jgi:SAM-dependent methyltransferase
MQAAPQNIYDRIRGLSVPEEISPEDWTLPTAAAKHHYFYLGTSNLLSVYNLLALRGAYYVDPVPLGDVLDFGCGFGRVTRWVRAAFPGARIHVTDLRTAGMDWCVEKYGCLPVKGELPANAFGFVWAGSVFTHLAEGVARKLLSQLLRSLRPRGILALTSHGRARIERMKAYKWRDELRPQAHFRLSRGEVDQIIAMYENTGYGYVNYQHKKDYGLCVASGHWYSQAALAGTEFTQILFQEKADNSQDLSAFMRQEVTTDTWGRLWGESVPIEARRKET